MKSNYSHSDRANQWLALLVVAAIFWGPAVGRLIAKQVADLSETNVLRDLVYKKVDGEELRLDLYLPKNATGKLPMILCIHGGGWSRGNKKQCPALMMVKEGYAIASIEYRLTDQAAFPRRLKIVKPRCVGCGRTRRSITSTPIILACGDTPQARTWPRCSALPEAWLS